MDVSPAEQGAAYDPEDWTECYVVEAVAISVNQPTHDGT